MDPPYLTDQFSGSSKQNAFTRRGNLWRCGVRNASAVGTLIELKSGYLIQAKMSDATATSAVAGFSAALNRMPLVARMSMTYDQGREMTQHAKVSQNTGVAIFYFCDPHSTWQSGTNENINGFIRQYLPT